MLDRTFVRRTIRGEMLVRGSALALLVSGAAQAQQIVVGSPACPIVGGVATLEIPAGDVEVIARGKAQGEMQLALRSYADIGGAPGRGVASRASAQGVRVFRAGQVTEVANP